jgi:hypothetical protein
MIKKLTAGSSDTLLSASRANEIIDAVNALLGMRVTPLGTGKLLVSGPSCVLDLTTTPAESVFPEVPQTGTYVLGTIDGVLTWIETEVC